MQKKLEHELELRLCRGIRVGNRYSGLTKIRGHLLGVHIFIRMIMLFEVYLGPP